MKNTFFAGLNFQSWFWNFWPSRSDDWWVFCFVFLVGILDLLGLLEIDLIVVCWWLWTEPRFSSIFLPFLVNQTQKQQTSARIQTQTQQSIFNKPRKLKSKQRNQTQTQIWPHPPILSCKSFRSLIIGWRRKKKNFPLLEIQNRGLQVTWSVVTFIIIFFNFFLVHTLWNIQISLLLFSFYK